LQGTPDTYFMFELTGYSTWITIDPTSGSLTSGTNEDMTVHLDATEIIIPGVYEAEIHFTTNPDVGSPVVDVTLTVAGLIPAVNLDGMYDCTDIMLTWEMPTGGNPDSWNVYRDGTLLGNATAMEYTDEMIMPETEYTYYVKAVYAGEESMATPDFMITAPIPEDLEPLNPEAVTDTPGENDVTLMWDAPDACVAPDGYNVYRDGVMINGSLVTAMEYVDPALSAGLYEYKVIAVYYFGESDFSNEAYVLITGINDLDASLFEIFPNPATELVTVNSPYEISSIRVLNNAGQSVADYEVNAASYQIDVSNLQSGIYFIRIETEEGQTLQKIAVK
ncbi:MAG: T9SS type A sorting domain-containing protein, partial [Bacteroidales bacterium]